MPSDLGLGRRFVLQQGGDPIGTRGGKACYRILGPLGDRSRERLFRMNVTLCLHRALRPDELERLPASFFSGAAQGLAGPPVAVLWETVPGAASTKPCANPGHEIIPGYADDPHGWVPRECGVCPSCQARATV